MRIDEQLLSTNFSFIEDKEQLPSFLKGLEQTLRTDVVKTLSAQHALFRNGQKTYHFSMVKLFSAIAKLSLPLLDTSHNPCFIGLSIIAAMDSLHGAVSTLPADPSAVCQAFYNQYKLDSTCELQLTEIEDSFASLTRSTSPVKARVASALNYLMEKRILEAIPQTESLKMIDFYLFVKD